VPVVAPEGDPLMTEVLDRPLPPATPSDRPTHPDRDRADDRRHRLRRLKPWHDDDPRWVRPAWVSMIVATAVLYIWGLGASGTANSFYAAAVQAGTKSWKAFLFGSIDSSNFITVDKPPASLWVMELSGRLFGFSSWSMLVPQALEGVAAVAILYAAVRRWSGPAAGLLAGGALAITPVAALMFRFNNPDALLVLVMTIAAYAVVRALEARGLRWMMIAGACLGLGFLTKMGQALLVVPAFGLVYLIAAPVDLRRRIGHLLGGVVALVVGSGWWIALVELWPAGSRPYIGGSTNNSALELALGYNGLGRLFGGSGNGGGGGGGSFAGQTGLGRLFNSEMGTQISWTIPATLVGLVFGLALRGRAPRADRTRAALLLWGGWFVATAITFSYMQGTIHSYYTVALAPAMAAITAISARELWRARDRVVGRVGLAAMVAGNTAWSYHLLDGTPSWQPWLRYAVLVAGIVATVGFLAPPRRIGRAVTATVVTVALIGGFGASAGYAVATAATAHQGSTPSAGPSGVSSGNGGGPGGSRGGGFGGGQMGTPPSGSSSFGSSSSGSGTGTAAPTSGGTGTTTSSDLVALLKKAGTKWSAAVVGSQTSAPLELSSKTAIMTIGGFTGSDATPTLAQFEAYVAAGNIHYFIASGSGGGGMGGGSGTASEITSWVEAHYTATTVGGVTVYDLTAAAK
jgi:4-amino-4-deoxy-L-arabinose transferase-like glycosyltransferase